MEENGGFIDVLLTPKLLQISPEYFLELLMAITPKGKERENIRKEWRKEFRKHQEDQKYFDQAPIGQQMNEAGKRLRSAYLAVCFLIWLQVGLRYPLFV